MHEKHIFKAPTKATTWDVFAIQWNPSKKSNWLAAAANVEVFVWDVNKETKVIKIHAKEVCLFDINDKSFCVWCFFILKLSL
jgi:hypothetical protein